MISSFDAETQLAHGTVRLTITTDPGHELQAGDAEFALSLMRAIIDHNTTNGNGNGAPVVGEPARRR